MSEEDIESGARGGADIATTLAEAQFGISVVTPENLEAQWLNFEAGACAKVVERSRLVPYLVGLTESEMRGPLRDFQMEQASREGTLKLVKSLNSAVERAGGRKLPEDLLAKAFEQNWPELQAKLDAALSLDPAKPKRRDPQDLLEEILGVVRMLERASDARKYPHLVAALEREFATSQFVSGSGSAGMAPFAASGEGTVVNPPMKRTNG